MSRTKGYSTVERLFYILQHLTNHEYATASELADYCKTSTRTIYRDMAKLEELGVSWHREGRFGYKLLSKPIQQNGRLTKEEWMALTLYPMLSEGITSGEHPFHLSYRSGLEKVMTYVQKGESDGALGERIRLHARPKDPAQINVMPAIIPAISENRTIKVSYYSIHRDQRTERKMDPYYLVPREGHLYVIAYCHLRELPRVFRLSRFEKVEATKKTFTIPKSFNIDEYLSQRWSIISDDTNTTFKVKFDKVASRYVLEEDFHVDTEREPQTDGSLILRTTVKSKEEFLRWIRSYGIRAEVLEPESVREELAAECEKMWKVYSEKKQEA
ncbi:transcriptional regulator [Alteribacter lacisalsi]|jgi:predicted DNA-binding transcriptional regulator YafY|uniref:Transcriptional regulator n=1 Tax=Alteribacter lacisalsi TaxID=2045244 RepID=A0A2W0H4P7_9BACI|nr:transcriptional regulator [Alteribacter lacisalsi]PYZ96803.1 transcriptional regulator [Alteribacter lacisalsi]